MLLIKKINSLIMTTILIVPIITSSLVKTYADDRFHDNYAKASIVSDLDTGRIIYEKNADKKYAMASMSKIMTLLITFDAIKSGRIKKTDIVDIKQRDVNREGTNIKLNAGDKIELDVLMKGMMIVSANDAALAISRYVGGSYDKFVQKMNQKAREIGMLNTVFYNPNGLPHKIDKDGRSTENTTTANDVLILSKWIYNHYPKQLLEITSMKRFVYKPKKIDEENTNPLLPILSTVDGLKTGFTDKAGYCLSYTMKFDKNKDAKNRIFGVTMGASSKEDREKSAYTTLKYIDKNYNTSIVYDPNSIVKNIPINNSRVVKFGLENKEPIYVVKKNNELLRPLYIYNKVDALDIFKKPIATLYYYNQRGDFISKEDLFLEKISGLETKEKIALVYLILKATITGENNTKDYPIISLDINRIKSMIKYNIENTYLAKELVKIKDSIILAINRKDG